MQDKKNMETPIVPSPEKTPVEGKISRPSLKKKNFLVEVGQG
jgi:hypothetical protein